MIKAHNSGNPAWSFIMCEAKTYVRELRACFVLLLLIITTGNPGFAQDFTSVAAPGQSQTVLPDGRWLEVPHAEARNRLFVLAPLSDLAPGLRPPGWHETVASARRRAAQTEGEDAVQVCGKL